QQYACGLGTTNTRWLRSVDMKGGRRTNGNDQEWLTEGASTTSSDAGGASSTARSRSRVTRSDTRLALFQFAIGWGSAWAARTTSARPAAAPAGRPSRAGDRQS